MFRRELETQLIPDLAGIVCEYLLGPHPSGVQWTADEKAPLFDVSVAEQRKAQQWYISSAREVHRWSQPHFRIINNEWEEDLFAFVGPPPPPPPPFDAHPYHSSADEEECKRGQKEDDDSDNDEKKSSDDEEEEDAVAHEEGLAALPAAELMLEPAAPMELDD
jgi:hypothetical protein